MLCVCVRERVMCVRKRERVMREKVDFSDASLEPARESARKSE